MSEYAVEFLYNIVYSSELTLVELKFFLTPLSLYKFIRALYIYYQPAYHISSSNYFKFQNEANFYNEFEYIYIIDIGMNININML
jgi:hypothetical protein